MVQKLMIPLRNRLKLELLFKCRHYHPSFHQQSLKLFTTSLRTSSAPPQPPKDAEAEALLAAATLARELASYQLRKEAGSGSGKSSTEKDQLISTLFRVQRELLEEQVRVGELRDARSLDENLEIESSEKFQPTVTKDYNQKVLSQENNSPHSDPTTRTKQQIPQSGGKLRSLFDQHAAKVIKYMKELDEKEKATKDEIAEELRRRGFSESAIKKHVAFLVALSWLMAGGVIVLGAYLLWEVMGKALGPDRNGLRNEDKKGVGKVAIAPRQSDM